MYRMPQLITSIYKYAQAKTRIMTGIQPTGNLTLGNYIGSVLNLLQLQKKYQTSEIFLSIVDLHSLTTAFSVSHANIHYEAAIGNNTLSMAKTLIAAGAYAKQNKQKNVKLFVQSAVKQHSELCWILGCIGPQHWLNMMIQYKEKSSQNSSLGIYSYPVLMAADILLYKAHYVPVGDDQKQHLQLTKRYAQRFNSIVKKQYFPLPQCIISQTPRIMSLVDPDKKMSKSDSNDKSRINLSDSKETIVLKIKKAVTDSNGSSVSYDPENRKGLANLLRIYASLSDKSIEETQKFFQKSTIKQMKEMLIEIIWKKLSVIQENYNNISNLQAQKILKEGSDQARIVASQTLKEVKQLLKLYPH